MNFIDKILLEATREEILDKHIKNPETGRSIKVSSALSYDDSHPAKKKALQMLAKADSSTKEVPDKKTSSSKPEEKRKSLKPHSVVVGVSKELKDMLAKKGYKNLNIYPQVTCTEKDIRFNPALEKGKNKNTTWICKFPAIQTNGKKIIKTAYTIEFMKAAQKIKYKKISKIKLDDLNKLYEKADKLMKNKDVRISDSACVIKILAKTGLRIGSTDTENSDTGNLGVRTLKVSNIKLKDGIIFFDYIGKSYQQNKAELKDAEIFEYLSKKIKNKKPTDNLFECSYNNCGQVMTKINPKINPKDLRTFKACEVASNYLNSKKLDLKLKSKDLIKQAKVILNGAFQTVSDVLNNTPAMAKNSYVHPAVITGWLDKLNLVPKQVGYKHITLERVNNPIIQRLTEDTLESQISEEDLYECEEYLLPEWFYEENWELVPKNK